MEYNELEQKVLENEQRFQDHRHTGLDSKELDFTSAPQQFKSLPYDAVTAPVGGTTIDGQARSAINDIITRLEQLGLIEEN